MKNSRPTYQVVMATYNGARYLNSQISSILSQLEDGELLIHDDGSSDDSVAILESWSKVDSRVKLIYAPHCGSAAKNFSYLLSLTDAPYVLCADQDDVWPAGRLRTLISWACFYESVYGDDVPLLIHGNLRVVNQNGECISDSFWDYQNLKPEWGDKFNLLLTQNVVTGCAMIVNRELLNRALPVPSDISMHDHWLALVACGQGRVVWVNDVVTNYRQHTSNVVGARRYNYRFIIKRLTLSNNNEMVIREGLERKNYYNTALHYARRFPIRQESESAAEFGQLDHVTLLRRITIILSRGFFKNGTWRLFVWILQPRKYVDLLTKWSRGT